jgi:ABC-type nitrate/sulfonate/bicarbonate transport system substrate-binding protein
VYPASRTEWDGATKSLQPDGITLSTLQDPAADVAGGHHFSDGLIGLIREGVSIPAFWTRSIGTPTWVLGLTWVDEKQMVVARRGSGMTGPSDLRGRTAAVAEPAPRRRRFIALGLSRWSAYIVGSGRLKA